MTVTKKSRFSPQLQVVAGFVSQAPSQIEAFNLINAWYTANCDNGVPTVTSEPPSAQGVQHASSSSPALGAPPPDSGGELSPGSVASLLQVRRTSPASPAKRAVSIRNGSH